MPRCARMVFEKNEPIRYCEVCCTGPCVYDEQKVLQTKPVDMTKGGGAYVEAAKKLDTKLPPNLSNLDQDRILGKTVGTPDNPETFKLSVERSQTSKRYLVRLSMPEFTSLCPVTGQPDFAHIIVDYMPKEYMVESKSLKLFMQSFRNYGVFHEAATLYIGDRIYQATKPHWLKVSGYWYPRGGIPIDVFWQSGTPPKGVPIPPHGIPTYKAR